MLGEWMYCISVRSNMAAKVWISAKWKNWPAFATGKSGELRFWMECGNIGRHAMSNPDLYPQTKKGFLPNLPMILELNPYRCLRFEICRFGDLPGFCARPLLHFGTSQKNWWFGTWDLENLWRYWVNFRVDTWHPMTLWMNLGWLAHGNHIPYHGNGSNLTGLTAILHSRVWKLGTTDSKELRSVGQDDYLQLIHHMT